MIELTITEHDKDMLKNVFLVGEQLALVVVKLRGSRIFRNNDHMNCNMCV